MKNFTFNHSGFTFERITKGTARRAYMNDLTVIVCPCNLRPFSPWGHEHRLNKKDRAHFIIDEIGAKNDFNNLIASFEFYNCNSNETGRYAAFYIPVEIVDSFTGENPTARTIKTIKRYAYSYMEG